MVRPLGVLFAAAIAAAAVALPAAQAADQVVTGTVAPMLGVGVGADGTIVGTVRAKVTREMRGDVLYVTVVPAG